MPVYESEYQVIQRLLREERQKCKEDVCMYCGGRAPTHERKPVGPNAAGNWTHVTKKGADYGTVLCLASAIFSRERFEGNRSVF